MPGLRALSTRVTITSVSFINEYNRGNFKGDPDTFQHMVGELRQNAEKARHIRSQKEKRDREQREIKRRKEREAYLEDLSGAFPGAWESLREAIDRESGRSIYFNGCPG